MRFLFFFRKRVRDIELEREREREILLTKKTVATLGAFLGRVRSISAMLCEISLDFAAIYTEIHVL